ncbi:MAG: DUF3187 family protein [Nitrospirae bacterium]|nr:DUF3187 family protein [Nitrospirota bacterium]
MKRFLLRSFAVCFFLFSVPASALCFGGPLQVKNHFPLFLHLNAPYLEAAAYDNSFSFNVSYSSVYMVRDSAAWSVNLDMEAAELDVRFRKEVFNLFELGIEVPFLSFNSGFLDDALSSYHRAFGFSDYGRSGRPANQFLYEVRRDGSRVLTGEGGGVGIGDIRITAKRALLSGDPAVSLMADIELPTGNASKGYGNGSFDTGIALLADKELTERLKAYANLGIAFPGHLRGSETLRVKEFVYGGICIEFQPWRNFGLLAQLFAQNSPFPKTGIGSLDRPAVLLTLGGRYYSGKNSFELSFTEDPNTSGAPDFTVSVGFKKSF